MTNGYDPERLNRIEAALELFIRDHEQIREEHARAREEHAKFREEHKILQADMSNLLRWQVVMQEDLRVSRAEMQADMKDLRASIRELRAAVEAMRENFDVRIQRLEGKP